VRNLLLISLSLVVPQWALAHGGGGHNHPTDVSQMPASLVGGDSGPSDVSISGSIASAPSSGGAVIPADGGGAPSSEINDVPASPPPPPLTMPNTVPNNTARSVPDRPGENPVPLNLDHKSTFNPRTNASKAIYQNAYNADVEVMNRWIKTFGN
jgi:hypothetical protein